jgi:hypothetical protein
MAFQTNVFRDGEWVTETVNLHSVLKSQKAGPKASTRKDPQKPPRCGLLTRTLVESALANSILPVRLRSPDHNDIAFVGVRVLSPSYSLFHGASSSALLKFDTRTTFFRSANSKRTAASKRSSARMISDAAFETPAWWAPLPSQSSRTKPEQNLPPSLRSRPRTTTRVHSVLGHQAARA